jgi:hypothetical protein
MSTTQKPQEINRYNPDYTFPTSSYYPTYPKTETYGVNPLTINSLTSVDIDDLQQIFAKGISDNKNLYKSQYLTRRALLENDHDLREVKAAINQAKRNQMICRQIEQNQILRLKNMIKESEEEEEAYKQGELERKKKAEEEQRKQALWLDMRRANLEQMEEKKRLKKEAEKEYERDRLAAEEALKKAILEDKAAAEEKERKRLVNQSYMEATIADRENRKRRKEEDERIEEENLRRYLADKAQRESDIKAKKDALQAERDRIFDKLSKDKAREEAEKDYWENVRNELQILRDERKRKIQELDDKIKRQKMREDVLASAINQMKEKEKRKEEEKKLEEEFKKEQLKIFEEEGRKERLMNEKRKQKEIEFNKEVERLWKIRLDQYKAQKEQEIRELEEEKRREEERRYIIEQEKARLIKENEDILRKYNTDAYNKLISSVKTYDIPPRTKEQMYNRNKHDVIYNNIFGNLNPNTPSVYPKYQHIKNYVYDINIQDVQKNINRCNHRMYNAYLNNNYDTYPTESEYREQMEKNNQKYIEYAGGPPIRENTCYIKNAPRMIDIQNGNYLNNNSKLNYSMNINNTVGSNVNNNLIYSQSINNKFVPNYNIIKSNTSQLDRSFGSVPSGSISPASTMNSRYQEQQKIPEMA